MQGAWAQYPIGTNTNSQYGAHVDELRKPEGSLPVVELSADDQTTVHEIGVSPTPAPGFIPPGRHQ